MTTIGRKLADLQGSGVLGQLVRFGMAGVASTLIYSAVYLPLATYALPPRLAVLAVPPAFLVAVTAGFFLHSAWSFRGHGVRTRGGEQQVKFVVVQGLGLLSNALFTWVMTDLMALPAWAPLIPVVTITPLLTFALNRQWVFGHG